MLPRYIHLSASLILTAHFKLRARPPGSSSVTPRVCVILSRLLVNLSRLVNYRLQTDYTTPEQPPITGLGGLGATQTDFIPKHFGTTKIPHKVKLRSVRK